MREVSQKNENAVHTFKNYSANQILREKLILEVVEVQKLPI